MHPPKRFKIFTLRQHGLIFMFVYLCVFVLFVFSFTFVLVFASTTTSPQARMRTSHEVEHLSGCLSGTPQLFLRKNPFNFSAKMLVIFFCLKLNL